MGVVTFVQDQAPNQTAEFKVPLNEDLTVQSVIATVDASSSGDVQPELAIANPAGVVMATKRLTEPIPGGGAGQATWALRLADKGHGGGAGVTGKRGVYLDAPHTIPDGGDTAFDFGFVDGDPLLDLSFAPAPRFVAGGVYVVTAWAFSEFAPADAGKVGVLKLFQPAHGPAGPTAAAWQSFPLDTSPNAASAAVCLPFLVAAGEFMQVTLEQNTGGPRDFGCALNVVKIG